METVLGEAILMTSRL